MKKTIFYFLRRRQPGDLRLLCRLGDQPRFGGGMPFVRSGGDKEYRRSSPFA